MMLLSNGIAETLVQESFFPLWRNFKALLFVNEFHKWVEVTVIIFESVPGNATALSRGKGFIPSATTKAPMWFVYIFLYIKLFKDLQAALYSRVGFSNNYFYCQQI